MNCTICHVGETAPGFATVTLEREGCVILEKEVPADVWQNSGEYYLSEDVSRELLRRCKEAIQQGAELQVLRWAA